MYYFKNSCLIFLKQTVERENYLGVLFMTKADLILSHIGKNNSSNMKLNALWEIVQVVWLGSFVVLSLAYN